MGNIFYNQVGGDKFWLRVAGCGLRRWVVSGEWWGAFGFKR
jgi:hypothetical protein